MKKSAIFKLKSKFFIYRAVAYFSFLLMPIWASKLKGQGPGVQMSMILLYILFMGGQWFLLGKEIDHKLRIYFRANSSIGRVLYRIMLGKLAMLLYFSLFSWLPEPAMKYFFWGTWLFLGLFYSWPTRGKIIRETVASNLAEFRFLDYLEKSIVILCIPLFLISIPEFSNLLNVEALKLVIDPYEKIGHLFWDFTRINYYPFRKNPLIYQTAWNLHFYCIGMGTLILSFYSFLRYFFSRRVSILGIFALLSSWTYPKLLASNIHWAITSSFLISWLWATLWATKAQTYRCGLFLGLLGLWGTIINVSYAFLIPVQILLLYFVFFRNRTRWFRNQVLKYMAFGNLLSIIIFISNFESLQWVTGITTAGYFSRLGPILGQKAFFILSLFGLILASMKLYGSFKQHEHLLVRNWRIDTIKLRQLIISLGAVFCLSIFVDNFLLYGFSMLWPICFLGLIPIEWIFQSLRKLRSKRNLIYGIYILICLLDSHIEGRIKILIRILS